MTDVEQLVDQPVASEQQQQQQQSPKPRPARKSQKVSDASKLPKSEDPQEILKQVEFYFSDGNLLNDKFLLDLSKKDPEGWVEISTIASFSRMRRFSPFEKIVEALKGSKELLEVSEDGKKVRRKVAVVEPSEEEVQNALARTVYVKGFGEEEPTTQFDLEKFFEKFGAVKQVRLRRTPFKKFKGSVFVEFEELEDSQKLLKETLEYNGNSLTSMSEKAYQEMKEGQQGFARDAKGGRKRSLINSYHYDKLHTKKKRSEESKPSDESTEESKKDSEVAEEPAAEEKAEEKTEEPVVKEKTEEKTEEPVVEKAEEKAEESAAEKQE